MSWLAVPLIMFYLFISLMGQVPSELTCDELVDFLEADKTNEISYIHTDERYFSPEDFVCHNFAMTLCHNAEEAGINAGYVSVRLEDGFHALNVFDTLEGLVFVDCSTGHDAFVALEIGKPYVATYSQGSSSTAMLGGLVLDYRIAWDIEERANLWP